MGEKSKEKNAKEIRKKTKKVEGEEGERDYNFCVLTSKRVKNVRQQCSIQ